MVFSDHLLLDPLLLHESHGSSQPRKHSHSLPLHPLHLKAMVQFRRVPERGGGSRRSGFKPRQIGMRRHHPTSVQQPESQGRGNSVGREVVAGQSQVGVLYQFLPLRCHQLLLSRSLLLDLHPGHHLVVQPSVKPRCQVWLASVQTAVAQR